MKTIRILITVLIVALAGCSEVIFVHHQPHKHLPPGQAKKIAGSQSAKPFAPGQRKKKD